MLCSFSVKSCTVHSAIVASRDCSYMYKVHMYDRYVPTIQTPDCNGSPFHCTVEPAARLKYVPSTTSALFRMYCTYNLPRRKFGRCLDSTENSLSTTSFASRTPLLHPSSYMHFHHPYTIGQYPVTLQVSILQ